MPPATCGILAAVARVPSPANFHSCKERAINIPSAGPARRGLLAAGFLFAATVLAACGPANAVLVRYNGYTLQTNRAPIQTGAIVFHINNQNGQVPHEFLVVQTDAAASQLPLGADSQVVESGLNIVGQAAPVDLGQSGTLSVHLPPGHYVLLCNIVGHYQLGMHADFTVSP